MWKAPVFASLKPRTEVEQIKSTSSNLRKAVDLCGCLMQVRKKSPFSRTDELITIKISYRFSQHSIFCYSTSIQTKLLFKFSGRRWYFCGESCPSFLSPMCNTLACIAGTLFGTSSIFPGIEVFELSQKRRKLFCRDWFHKISWAAPKIRFCFFKNVVGGCHQITSCNRKNRLEQRIPSWGNLRQCFLTFFGFVHPCHLSVYSHSP